MGKLQIEHIKAPLKKYKDIIDEFQEIKKEEKNDYDFEIHQNDILVAHINQLIVDNCLDNDLICDVFGCSGEVYAKFFTNNLDDVLFKDMVNKFSILFCCYPFQLYDTSNYFVTSVPKYVNGYWKLKYYMLYNRMILCFRKLWGDELYKF